MTNMTREILRPNKAAYIALASLLLSASLWAQKTPEREKNDSIAAKYKNENAVYTNYTEHLIITEDDGELQANSYVTMDKLLISDVAPTTQNADFFQSSDLHPVINYSATAMIPDKKGGYKKVPNYGLGAGGQFTGSFYDDVMGLEAYYTGLTKNSVTETKYTLQSTNINLLPGFYFQDEIPILNSVYEVTAPDYVKMKFVIRNDKNINIKETKEDKKDGKITYRFIAKDLRAFKSYTQVPSAKYYVPHIIPYIESFRLTGAKKDSVILRDPEALYKYDYSYVKDLNIKLDTPLVRIVNEITKNDKTQREKTAHIYNWVQNHIHYIAFEKGMQGLVPRPADTVFKRKYGDCKDMASICMAMCRQAGIKAYFASIGTTDIPYSIDEVHSQHCFNHKICAVNLDNDWVFLDATDNIQPFGANREDIQGKEAFISIDANNYKIVKIPVEPADKNVVTDSTFIRLSYTQVTGSIKRSATGYHAWDMIRTVNDYKNEDRDKIFKEILSRGADNYQQLKYAVNVNENKNVTLSADFNLPDYAHMIGKEYIINMNLDRPFGNQRMNDSERSVGYYYRNKSKTTEVVVLDIPEGYKVTHLPAEAHGSLDGVWNYKISYSANKEKVVLTKEYELQSLSLDASAFAMNNKVIDDLNHAYKESVVLTANK